MHNSSDKVLTQKIQQENKLAFDNLFFKYYKVLYRFALNISNDPVIAEESVQNTFIKIWKNNSKLNPTDDIGKVLFVYTKNETIDEIRKVKARKKYENSVIIDTIINEQNLNTEQCIAKSIIESAIEHLPKKSKEIFRLAKQEGLSILEISEYLKISKKTVENQLTIAYKKMRNYLEPFKSQLSF